MRKVTITPAVGFSNGIVVHILQKMGAQSISEGQNGVVTAELDPQQIEQFRRTHFSHKIEVEPQMIEAPASYLYEEWQKATGCETPEAARELLAALRGEELQAKNLEGANAPGAPVVDIPRSEGDPQ